MMKKPNRIARKGDSTRTPAQSKQAPAALAASAPLTPDPDHLGNEIKRFDNHRLFRNGRTYHLVSEYEKMDADEPGAADSPGLTVLALTREQVRDWLDKTVISELIPYEFRRDFRHRSGRGNETANLTLGELLDTDAINGLNQLGAAEDMRIGAQVAGAVASWLSFAEQQGEFPEARQRLREAPGILCAEQFEYTIERERKNFLTRSTAEFFLSLVEQAKRKPFPEAVEFLSNLADLIEFHPGLAEEFATLHKLTAGECCLGRSTALNAILKP